MSLLGLMEVVNIKLNFIGLVKLFFVIGDLVLYFFSSSFSFVIS